MPKTRKERRGEVYPAEMAGLVLGKGWLDGRDGYLFCRIETALDPYRLVRAEITWNDNSEERKDGKATVYFDPMITLESNRLNPGNPDAWVIVDAVHIDISGDEAVRLVRGPSSDVLADYSKEIYGLRLWEGVGDAAA